MTVDPRKGDRSNISPAVYEAFRWGLADMMIGADRRTEAPGFEVLTDSSGFDSPRSSHTGSLKTSCAKRGEDEEVRGGLRRRGCKRKRERVGNKSICRVVRAGGGSRSSRGFLKFAHGPPLHFFASFLPFHFFLPCKPSDSLALAFFCPSFFPSLW